MHIWDIKGFTLIYLHFMAYSPKKKPPQHSLVGKDSFVKSFKKFKPQKMWSTCIIILINHNDCNQPFAMKITFAIWRMAFVLPIYWSIYSINEFPMKNLKYAI